MIIAYESYKKMVELKELSKEDYYYRVFPLSKNEMKIFLKRSKKNWKKAVLEIKTSDYFKDFIINEKIRGKLADFMKKGLNLKKNNRVLDIGAGTGALTLALARRFDVSATDANLLSLKFVKQRAEQEKIKLKLYKTPMLHKGLPFKKESFDVVVMNGVLEWVAVGVKKGKVKEIQEKVLKEVYRILKKKGLFVLAIENRLSPLWLKGKTSHIPVKFLDIMPRKLADIVCKLKTGNPFRAYIYSKEGYEKILKKTGFKKIEFYEAFPNYQKPIWIKKTRNLFANSFVIIGRR